MYDQKRAQLEQKLKRCEHMRQSYAELYQGAYIENKELERRLRVVEKMNARLMRKQKRGELSFRGFVE